MNHRLTLLTVLAVMTTAAVQAQEQLERLSRGVVAIKNGNNTFVSWRVLGTDSDDVTFDLLRDGKVLESNLTVSNVSTTGGTDDSQYQVVVKENGEVVETSDAVRRWGDVCQHIRLDRYGAPHIKACGQILCIIAENPEIACQRTAFLICTGHSERSAVGLKTDAFAKILHRFRTCAVTCDTERTDQCQKM